MHLGYERERKRKKKGIRVVESIGVWGGGERKREGERRRLWGKR